MNLLKIILMHSKPMHVRNKRWLLCVNVFFFTICALVSTIAYPADNTLYATFSLHNHTNHNCSVHPSYNRAAIRQSVQNTHAHLPSTHTPNLLTHSSHQLATYFAHYSYTENMILSQNTLYLSDEFVKLAKTYPGYEIAIRALHKKIHQLGFWGKLWHWIHDEYCPGLDKRIESLHTEIQKSQTNNHNESILKPQITLPQCQKQLISALESHTNQAIVVETLDQLTQHVFNQAELYHCPIATQIEKTINASLDILHATSNPDEFIFHTAFIDHILCDIEEHSTQLTHSTLLERSPKLLVQALTTFVKAINPVTQVKNTCEFIINTAHFVADATLGKLYLSNQQYDNRIATFWSSCEALSPSNLAKLEAEQWVDLIAQCAADCVFFGSVGKAVKYLKEIEAVSKTQQQAIRIAQRLQHAIDASLAEQPLLVTTEGYMLRASNEMKQLGSATKEIITDSRALLESACTGLLANLEKEMTHLRMLFDGKIKGFAEFSNKWIKIDYEHILGMDLSFSKRGIPQIGGFHHDFMHTIEKNSIIKFVNKTMHQNGFYSADLLINGTKIPKTFFPAKWSREKVINQICEAYDNFIIKKVIPDPKPNGKYLISGFTKEGIQIEMCLTQKGILLTAYPLLK